MFRIIIIMKKNILIQIFRKNLHFLFYYFFFLYKKKHVLFMNFVDKYNLIILNIIL